MTTVNLKPTPNPNEDPAKKLKKLEDESTEHRPFICSLSGEDDSDEEDDEITKLIDKFNKMHNQDSNYLPPKKKKSKPGSIFFSDDKQMMEFAEMAAKDNMKFMAIGKNGQVLAYSTGDGNLYHNDENLSVREVSDIVWGKSMQSAALDWLGKF